MQTESGNYVAWGYASKNCALYDKMYQYGLPILKMRVSNVHHEMAVGSLFYLQEIEPETYARLTQRISGIDMAGKMGTEDYFPKKLPTMFEDWKEYRDYLLENLVQDPKWKKSFKNRFDALDWYCGGWSFASDEARWKVCVTSILTNDWEGLILSNYKIGFTRDPERKAHYLSRKATRPKHIQLIETPDYEPTDEDEKEFDGSI